MLDSSFRNRLVTAPFYSSLTVFGFKVDGKADTMLHLGICLIQTKKKFRHISLYVIVDQNHPQDAIIPRRQGLDARVADRPGLIAVASLRLPSSAGSLSSLRIASSFASIGA